MRISRALTRCRCPATRAATLQAQAAGASASSAAPARDVFPLVPIGTLHSCFSQRNGTPRQARKRTRGAMTRHAQTDS
jgi:hypothetical protein